MRKVCVALGPLPARAFATVGRPLLELLLGGVRVMVVTDGQVVLVAGATRLRTGVPFHPLEEAAPAASLLTCCGKFLRGHGSGFAAGAGHVVRFWTAHEAPRNGPVLAVGDGLPLTVLPNGGRGARGTIGGKSMSTGMGGGRAVLLKPHTESLLSLGGV